MKFVGLDGREYNIRVGDYKVVTHKDGRSKVSSHHKRARSLLRDMYSGYTIMEEMKIAVLPRQKLFLDFYIPTLQIAVEVHGRQHYQFVPHFHKSRAGYRKAMRRDKMKQEWSEVNDLSFVVLKYSEDNDYWRQQLESRSSD